MAWPAAQAWAESAAGGLLLTAPGPDRGETAQEQVAYPAQAGVGGRDRRVVSEDLEREGTGLVAVVRGPARQNRASADEVGKAHLLQEEGPTSELMGRPPVWEQG